MPSSLSQYPTIQKLLDYLAGLGASSSILDHVRDSWDIEVKARRQGGADIYWLSPGHPGRFSSMVKAAEYLGLQPPKRSRPTPQIVEESDSDEGYKQAQPQDLYGIEGSDRPRPKRQTRPPQRTSMDWPMRNPRGRSLPPPSPPPSLGRISPLHTPLHAAAPPPPGTFKPYPSLDSSYDVLATEHTAAASRPAAAALVTLPPVLLELEPADPSADVAVDVLGLMEGASVEWVASFILHARTSCVHLIDKSGLILASQNALALQYVVERGCLRILPLLDEEPPEGWASQPVATPADQLGSAFDSGPAHTGKAVTGLLNQDPLRGAAGGAGDEGDDDGDDDEWALLDLRVPAGRVACVRPDGSLQLQDSCLLPACLAQPQQPVYVQLQPQQLGQEGPGVEMVFRPMEEVLEARRQQALLSRQLEEEQRQHELERKQQEQQRQQQLEELRRHRQQMEELQRQRQHLEQLQQALQQQALQQEQQLEQVKQQQEQQELLLPLQPQQQQLEEQQGEELKEEETLQEELQEQAQETHPAQDVQEGGAGVGALEAAPHSQEQGEPPRQLQYQQVPNRRRGGARTWGRRQADSEHPAKPQVLPDNASGGSPNGPVPRKSCNCRKSRCLKLYCECFAAGHYCENCCCVQCLNNQDNESKRQQAVDFILERNPFAFQSKIQEEVVTPDDSDTTPDVMGKHRKGCTCKKSACLKKYCECFQASVFCSESCRCNECKNFEGSEQLAAVRSGVGLETTKNNWRTWGMVSEPDGSLEWQQQQQQLVAQQQQRRQQQLQQQRELEQQLQQQQRQQRGGPQVAFWDVVQLEKTLLAPLQPPQPGPAEGSAEQQQQQQQQLQPQQERMSEPHGAAAAHGGCAAVSPGSPPPALGDAGPTGAGSTHTAQANGPVEPGEVVTSQREQSVDGPGLPDPKLQPQAMVAAAAAAAAAVAAAGAMDHQTANLAVPEQQQGGVSWEERLRLHYQSLSPPPAEQQVARPTVTTAAAPIMPWQ